ncbi:MAG: N-acetylmuramoyl-L-alanine amidase [Phenylobacterium sp.]|uniref:N-acetylmuramoyl-L-alanine amidase family protein n=1 Tax=Phenylobacterium sp. TaxID=1871053 RepID=UPI0025FA4442|nr:N-acetylmuramoyl-L-alanine amidase [Phenylobacterium sp.]MBA4012265.1 N-acetylmuramoyl-L-alanine amidase [Phenylobacterium sp.]
MGGRFRIGGRSVLATVGAVVCCLAIVAGAQAAGAKADILKVRLGGDRAETRIVIDLDKSATGKVASDGQGDRRVVLSLPGVSVDNQLQGGGLGLVKAWVVDDSAGGARLRIDLADDAVIKRRFLLPPADGVANYRYVIDLAAKAPANVRVAQAAAGPRFISAPVKTTKAALPLKKVIVIDAGHGGKDPGTKGADGNEKDVTLAAARALKSQLEKSGRYKVVMTRDADVYVDHAVRVQVARRADADLFISLHADSGTDPSLRGASVYTLADRATSRSAKFVSKDDWFMQAGSHGDHGVSTILLDLTQRMTRNRSATFAEVLLERVSDHQPLLRRSHREAGLAVLLAPDVPAVLLEMGFLTNAADEAVLRDPGKRTRLMGSVAEAIDDYFGQPTKLASN